MVIGTKFPVNKSAAKRKLHQLVVIITRREENIVCYYYKITYLVVLNAVKNSWQALAPVGLPGRSFMKFAFQDHSKQLGVIHKAAHKNSIQHLIPKVRWRFITETL